MTRRATCRVLPFHGFFILISFTFSLWCLPALATPEDKEYWNRKYQTDTYLFGTSPISFLTNHVHLLPKGHALDIAMGEGRNGVFLAIQGFEVTGIDISEEGLKKAHALAANHNVTITTEVTDLTRYQIPEESYDVILCTYYLQRDLFPQIIAGLKPGGMALIETYTLDHLTYQAGFPEQYLLKTNELLELLAGLKVIRYQHIDDGQAAYSSILVQKSG